MEIRYVCSPVVDNPSAVLIPVVDGTTGIFVETDIVPLEIIERIVAGDNDGIAVDLIRRVQRLVEAGFEPGLLLARRETVLIVEMDAVQSDNPDLGGLIVFQPEAGLVVGTGGVVIALWHRNAKVVDIVGVEGVEVPGFSHIIPVCRGFLVPLVIGSDGSVVVAKHEKGLLCEPGVPPPLGVIRILFRCLCIV